MELDRRDFVKGAVAAGVVAAGGSLLNPGEGKAEDKFEHQSENHRREGHMNQLRFFMDTHDKAHNTFPAKITPLEFEGFYAKYEKACYAEGVIPVRLHVGYQEGRAFCFNMAPNEEAVKRAHDRVGLPYDSITEVLTATPGDTFFRAS
jgi:hypothetical protein